MASVSGLVSAPRFVRLVVGALVAVCLAACSSSRYPPAPAQAASADYRYLIGPVSISNTFSKFSKSLIVDYINRNHFDHEMAQYVKPRKKFKVDFSKIDTDLLMAGEDSFKGLDNLISEVETRNMKVPVLLRQYIALNAKIISFNIDPKFADCLDGFLVLDLEKVPQDILDKLGKNL